MSDRAPEDLPANIKAYLDNAMRLLDDAELLRQHRRNSSAFVLTVISLEEVGKAILEFWRRDGREVARKGKGTSAHINKQSAVACLVVAGELAADLRNKGAGQNDEGSDGLAAAALSRGSLGRMVEIERKVLDRAKQAGLYQDDDGSEVPAMRAFTVDEINDVARDALLALGSVPDRIAMRIGYALYKANLTVLG